MSTQRNQNLGSSREALGKNTCEADVIPSSELLEVIYGKLEDIAVIRAELEKEKLLSDRGWKALYTSEKDSYLPSQSPLEEDEAFAGLATIFEQCLCAAGINATECIVQFSVHGHADMETSLPNRTRLGATVHLSKSSFKWARVRIDHCNVYLYVEFKKRNTPTNFEDDASKLLWNVHHRFRYDPRCRFVCGLTIEDTTARFWHFSRAAVMVSEPFDIITVKTSDCFTFEIAYASDRMPINLFTSLYLRLVQKVQPIWASTLPSNVSRRTQMIRDNTRLKLTTTRTGHKSRPDRGQSCMHTSITERVISNYRAVGIRSRGCWVFEGTEGVKPGGAPVVIKDVWIDSDSEVEGTILENVREALRDTPEKLQLFLEPLCHGRILIDGVKDLTQPLLKSKKIMKLAYSGNAAASPSISVVYGRTSTPNPPTEEPDVISRRGDRRKHYRIVFKGKAGHTLQDLKSHQEVFTGLLGGVKALHALHGAGYIHRDLSAGNVLLVKEAEEKDRGVLIDLEYAKRFLDTSKEGHDVRTGTPYFMAVEVNTQAFLFLPPSSEDPLSALLGTADHHLPPTPTTVPWFHNPIHDIESAWWIALWTFHNLNRAVGANLFTNDSHQRDFLSRHCSALPGPVFKLLDSWLSFIRAQYMKLEGLVSTRSHASFDYDHVFVVAVQFIEAIIKVLPNEQDSTLQGEELATSAEGSPRKRRRIQHGQASS